MSEDYIDRLVRGALSNIVARDEDNIAAILAKHKGMSDRKIAWETVKLREILRRAGRALQEMEGWDGSHRRKIIIDDIEKALK